MANIYMLAPAPNMSFGTCPSGSTYTSDVDALIVIVNESVADQLYLVSVGCKTLSPIVGGGVSTQNGTAYTVQTPDQNDEVLFTAATAVGVSLPNSFPVGFVVELFQIGAGQVTASAANGASVVTPNLATTPAQYSSLFCMVVSNTTGTNAEWTVISNAVATSGIVGATTLADLYTVDSAAHYPQYTIAEVFSDGTPSNDGTWLKTGTGNGNGNWTQVLAVTLAGVNTALSAEVTRAESTEQGLFDAFSAAVPSGWADDGLFIGGFFDASGNPIFGLTAANNIVGSAALPLSYVGYCWPDDTLYTSIGGGTMPMVDASGNVIAPFGAAAGLYDDYCPYVNKPDGSLHATNTDAIAAGLNVMIANTRGTPSSGGVSGVTQSGPILKWVDDATTSGIAPLIERRQFDWRGGSYLAALGSITKLVHVIDIGHSLTVGGTDHAPITMTPFFNRGVMFNSGPKVYPPNTGSGYIKPRPLTADLYIQSLAEYWESDCDGSGGESHGGGVVTWFSTGSNLGSTEAIMFTTVGTGGNLMSDLSAGQPCYADMIRVAERSAAIAKANGWAWECYITCSIGENDFVTYQSNASGFQAAIVAMQAAAQPAIQSIFTQNGWSTPTYVPIICEQPSSWTCSVYNLTTCALVYVFPALTRSSANLFKLIGPEYYTACYNPAGYPHKLSTGYKLDGEYMGRAVMKVRTAASVPGLYVTGCSNSGNTLTITTNATSNLVIDTSVVSDPGQSGLRILDVTAGNTNIALSSISVSGGNITATLASHTAGHTLMLGIGDIGVAGNAPGPTTGPRTTIRDSSTDVSSSDTNSTAMYNYLSHDQFQFTASA